MKCQHGNEITVLVELYADSYENFTLSKYNSEGEEYSSFVPEHHSRKFEYLQIKGCPQCKTIKFEEV